MGKKKKVGLKLTDALHRNVKAESARRGLSMEDAFEQALNAWLTGVAVPAPAPGHMEVPESMRDFVEFLVDWFSIQGSAEEELAKITIRQLAGQRAADLRRDPNKERTAVPVTEFPQQKEERPITEFDNKKRVGNGG